MKNIYIVGIAVLGELQACVGGYQVDGTHVARRLQPKFPYLLAEQVQVIPPVAVIPIAQAGEGSATGIDHRLLRGMAGAAIATIGGQIVSAILAAVYLFRMKAVRLNRDCFRFHPKLLRTVLSLGMASFLNQISIVLSMAATLNAAVKCGAADAVFGLPEYAQIPTAVIGIVMKLFQIIISIAVGLAAGCIPIAGYNVGAGRNDRVVEVMRRLIAAEVLVGLAATAVFLLFPRLLIQLFGAGNESVYYAKFAVWFIRAQLCLLPLACINKGTVIFLQSLGKAKESSVLSITRELVLGVGLPILLPVVWGLYALPLFMPAADTLTFIVVAFVLIKTKKELKTAGQ